MYKNMIIAILLLITTTHVTEAQKTHDYPEIGKPCPDFELNEVHQYKSTKVSLHDFSGKLLIVDFFEQYCSTCFKSFPILNQLQKQFKDQVQFLIVGYDKNFLNSKLGVRETYQKFQKRYGIDIPVAYDSLTVDRFKIQQFPYEVWIDEAGIVRAITTSEEVTEENILKFVNHEPLNFRLALNKDQMETENFYDIMKPLLIGGNGGNDTDFVYRSLLMKWKYRQSFYFDRFIGSQNSENIQGVGLSLNTLYQEAYGDTVVFTYPRFINDVGENHFGQWSILPVLEIRDSSLFEFDATKEKNLFSYNLTVRGPHKAREMQLKMQADLHNYFGYDVKVEKRKMPYWRLRATEAARQKLKTKGGVAVIDGVQSQIEMVNQPVSLLINIIWSYNQYEVYVDETGISSNIDLSLEAVLTEFEDVKKALLEQGLILERATKDMKVIVIRDPVKEE